MREENVTINDAVYSFKCGHGFCMNDFYSAKIVIMCVRVKLCFAY